MTKRCSKCGEHKPRSAFQLSSRNRGGLQAWCKRCTSAYNAEHRERPGVRERRNELAKLYYTPRRRKQQTLRAYGLTLEDYDRMLCDQRGRCAVCDRPLCGPRDPHVDHDHVDDRVRALLCSLCNKGLGHFHDDPDLLRAAANYLEAHRTCPHPD